MSTQNNPGGWQWYPRYQMGGTNYTAAINANQSGNVNYNTGGYVKGIQGGTYQVTMGQFYVDSPEYKDATKRRGGIGTMLTIIMQRTSVTMIPLNSKKFFGTPLGSGALWMSARNPKGPDVMLVSRIGGDQTHPPEKRPLPSCWVVV